MIIGEWKIRDIPTALEALSQKCPELCALNLSGWKGLSADNLKYITTECKKLERLDLSSINVGIANKISRKFYVKFSDNIGTVHYI